MPRNFKLSWNLYAKKQERLENKSRKLPYRAICILITRKVHNYLTLIDPYFQITCEPTQPPPLRIQHVKKI